MRCMHSKTHSLHKILEAMSDYANSFSYVVRDGMAVSSKAVQLIDELSPYLLSCNHCQEWPGTKLLIGSALLFSYSLSALSANVLVNTSDDIYEYILPNLPEDIVLYQNDTPVFISVTHEKDSYFIVDHDTEHHLLQTGLI